MTVLIIIALLLGGYLFGAISSAVWISRRFYGIDIRQHGSGNAGATNMLRVLGPKAALPVFVIDAAKGYAAVSLSYLSDIGHDEPLFFYLQIGLVVVAILGHIFPVFTGFKGGKGVATIAGCVLALSPLPLLLSLATFIVILAITHYVSLGSMVSGALYPVYMYFVFGDRSTVMVVFGVVVAIMLLITHRKNIKRLVQGNESKTYIFKKYKKKTNPEQ